MNGNTFSRVEKTGRPPGAMIHIGQQRMAATEVRFIDYDAAHFHDRAVVDLAQIEAAKEAGSVSWVLVAGLHDTELIGQICDQFAVHPLLAEDLLNSQQRPKIEEYEDYFFLTLKLMEWEEEAREVRFEQVTIIQGKAFILTFLEQPTAQLEPLIARLQDERGRLRRSGSDYLAHALVDIIVDHYFVVFERIEEQIALVETQLYLGVENEFASQLVRLKMEMLQMRRQIWPLRELLNNVLRGDARLDDDENVLIYWRDVYDHTVQMIDTIDTLRENVSVLFDLYQTLQGNKLNQVTKLLTIIATLFIPLTFVTGLYGMNFRYMPELQWRYGYLLVWLIILTVVGSMLLYFKRKGWL